MRYSTLSGFWNICSMLECKTDSYLAISCPLMKAEGTVMITFWSVNSSREAWENQVRKLAGEIWSFIKSRIFCQNLSLSIGQK